MRLKSVIWAKAYVRRCSVAGAAAYVVRHGDDDAGAIYIKVSAGRDLATLYGPAPMSLDTEAIDRQWSVHLAPKANADQEIDAYLARQYAFDRDIWVLEVEDREGRHFLDSLRSDV